MGYVEYATIIDELARGLVLEELCEKAARRVAGAGLPPEVVGQSIAPLVAASLDRMYVHGAGPDAASDSLPVRLLVEVKRMYEGWLKANGFADPAWAKSAYMPRADEFVSYGTVVIDGFYDADPAETRTLAALSKVPDCTFLLEAPGISRPESHGEGMPYHGADALLSALGVPTADARCTPEDAEIEAGLYSGALFEGSSFRETEQALRASGGPVRRTRQVGALNPAEEVYYIARDIKSRFLAGEITDLGRVLVFFKDTDGYLPLIDEAFTDLGVPFHVSTGRPLMQSPVVSALMDLLTVPRGGYSFRDIRRALGSPLLRFGEGGNHADAFDAFARGERIPGGRARWLAALGAPRDSSAEEAAVVEGPLKRLFSLALPFEAGHEPLPVWADRTRELMEESGLAPASREVAASNPDIGAAMDALSGALEEVREAAMSLSRRVGPATFVYALRKALAGRRYKPGACEAVSGVRVLDRNEVPSEPFEFIYAGGLIENVMPAPRRKELFFPWPDEERARDARLFLSLVLGAGDVCLTYPESRGAGQVSRSPYLRAMEPFIVTRWAERETRACRSLETGDALSPSELVRSLALGQTASGRADAAELSGILARLPEDTPGLALAKAALSPAREATPLTPPVARTFTVTELEEYLLCHYRYYQGKVLQSAPEDEPEDDIAPHRAGSIIHRILKTFYEKAGGPVTADNKPDNLALLKGIARKEFASLPDTVANRELARRFQDFLAPRFIETESELAGTGYGVCAAEMPVEIDVDDPDYGHIVITGKIDRLELDKDGEFAVVDYKTGRYETGMGKQFQLPVYAGMVREKGAELLGVDKPLRPSSLVYYNLRDGGYRDVVVYNSQAANARTRKKFSRRGRTPEELDRLVTESLDAAKEAARGIIRGEFQPTCEDAKVCELCVYIEVCVRGKGMEAEDSGDGGAGNGDGGGIDAAD